MIIIEKGSLHLYMWREKGETYVWVINRGFCRERVVSWDREPAIERWRERENRV